MRGIFSKSEERLLATGIACSLGQPQLQMHAREEVVLGKTQETLLVS